MARWRRVTTSIGRVPLEILDVVVDPKGRRLFGSPDHGGEPMRDLL